MAYYEGEISSIGTNNGNGMFGNDGWWGIILLALLFGWGRGGYGFGGGSYGPNPASQADLASGFATSEIMSDLNSIQLANAQGYAGLNTAILQGFHGVDNAVCTLGYNMATGFNGVNQTISSCCCDLKSMLMENRYLNEKQTCDIIQSQTANTQRLVDLYTSNKIEALTAENVALKGRISNDAQTAAIVGALAPKQPIPAYPVFPTTSFAYPSGVTFGVGNNCCGCGGASL